MLFLNRFDKQSNNLIFMGWIRSATDFDKVIKLLCLYLRTIKNLGLKRLKGMSGDKFHRLIFQHFVNVCITNIGLNKNSKPFMYENIPSKHLAYKLITWNCLNTVQTAWTDIIMSFRWYGVWDKNRMSSHYRAFRLCTHIHYVGPFAVYV